MIPLLLLHSHYQPLVIVSLIVPISPHPHPAERLCVGMVGPAAYVTEGLGFMVGPGCALSVTVRSVREHTKEGGWGRVGGGGVRGS